MDKQQQEQQVKELENFIGEHAGLRWHDLAEDIITSGWRKAGELTTLTEEPCKDCAFNRPGINPGTNCIFKENPCKKKIEYEHYKAQRDHDREA